MDANCRHAVITLQRERERERESCAAAASGHRQRQNRASDLTDRHRPRTKSPPLTKGRSEDGQYYYYYYYKSKDCSDTITQKRCRGTLQSSKCKYSARTFALLASVQRAKVTQSSTTIKTYTSAIFIKHLIEQHIYTITRK